MESEYWVHTENTSPMAHKDDKNNISKCAFGAAKEMALRLKSALRAFHKML